MTEAHGQKAKRKICQKKRALTLHGRGRWIFAVSEVGHAHSLVSFAQHQLFKPHRHLWCSTITQNQIYGRKPQAHSTAYRSLTSSEKIRFESLSGKHRCQILGSFIPQPTPLLTASAFLWKRCIWTSYCCIFQHKMTLHLHRGKNHLGGIKPVTSANS